jgi:hypothetical protein
VKNPSNHLPPTSGYLPTPVKGVPSAHLPPTSGYPPTPVKWVPGYPREGGARLRCQFTILICTTPRAQRGPAATMPANHTGASPSGRRLARFALGTPLRGWSPLKKPDRSNSNPNGRKEPNTRLETLEVIFMAATTITTDWAALAKTLWPRAQIIGTGANAVVNRCHFPHVDVSLFENEADARAYEAALCCPSCDRKHTFGNIERFAPPAPFTPTPSARMFYRSNSLRRMMLSED